MIVQGFPFHTVIVESEKHAIGKQVTIQLHHIAVVKKCIQI